MLRLVESVRSSPKALPTSLDMRGIGCVIMEIQDSSLSHTFEFCCFFQFMKLQRLQERSGHGGAKAECLVRTTSLSSFVPGRNEPDGVGPLGCRQHGAGHAGKAF